MLLTHATASRIKTYKQCEFRYFLEYVIQYPPMKGDNIYSGKGHAVHEALEGWVNAKLGVVRDENDPKASPVNENWEETIRSYYEKSKLWTLDQRLPEKGGFPHPVEKTCESCPYATKDNRCTIANMAIDAVPGCPRPHFEEDKAMVGKTIAKRGWNPLALDADGNFKRKIIGTEVPFDMELGGVRVKGKIDLVVEGDDPGTIEIVDYKSGKSMSFDAAFNDAQVRIYGAVAHELYPQYDYIDVTLWYLKKTPVTVPLGPVDHELTIKSLQHNARQIENVTDPRQVRPSKWGFPCDWCIGYETCVDIKDKFRVAGKFRLPTISCSFASSSEPCWGSIYPAKSQKVGPDNVHEIVYTCKGHTEVHGGGEYIPKSNDSDSSSGPDKDSGEEVQSNKT